MITFSNGHKLDFACASGALSWHGRGWWWERPLVWAGIIDPRLLTVVAKTVTYNPKEGNLKMYCPWRCVRLVDGGAVNAIGLTNGGFKQWIDDYYPIAKEHGYKIACSIQVDTLEQAEVMGSALDPLGLAYVELNPSCPNVDGHGATDYVKDVLDSLQHHCRHPIVVKLSYGQTGDREFIKMLGENPQVEAIHCINTVPWEAVYPRLRSPLGEHTGGKKGGVSGPQIFPYTLRALGYLQQATHLPIIAGGGISSLSNVYEAQIAGASAFSIGTLFLRRPWEPKRIINKYRSPQ